MKLNYIQPQTTMTLSRVECHLCAVSLKVPKGARYVRWGSDYAVADFGNPDWVNEKFDAVPVQSFEAVLMGGDTAGPLDSRGNSSLWDE